MKTNKFIYVVALVAVGLSLVACSVSASTANFADAFMAKDSDGNERTTTYGQSDIFYAIVDLANAPSDTAVRAEWFAVDVEGADPNTPLNQFTITSGSARITFNAANAEGLLWPPGTFRVDLYLNDDLKTSLEFQVQ